MRGWLVLDEDRISFTLDGDSDTMFSGHYQRYGRFYFVDLVNSHSHFIFEVIPA